jgi:hypothetical protein
MAPRRGITTACPVRARRARAVPARSREVRDQRLCRSAAAGRATGAASAPEDRRAALRLPGLPSTTCSSPTSGQRRPVSRSSCRLPGGLTTGRIDTRFSGPSLDLLSKEAQYDPFITSVGSAYVAAWNDYRRSTLHFPAEDGFKIFAPVFPAWDMAHQAPGMPMPFTGQTTNVMLDLATVMKQNPNLKVLNTGGYYDLATPYFEGVYEMEHLPIPDSLRANIEYKYFPSGTWCT